MVRFRVGLIRVFVRLGMFDFTLFLGGVGMPVSVLFVFGYDFKGYVELCVMYVRALCMSLLGG